MCLRVSKLRKEMWNKKRQNSGDWYWNIILYKKETVIRVSNKHCDLSSCMYYLKFTFKGPEYTRNIVFLMILLQIFSNIKKLWLLFLKLNNFRKHGILSLVSDY